jgi:Flp pilus assembly pilin Flp
MKTIKLNQRIGGKKQLGQGMTEYIVIVALIAVAAIGFYSAFGHTLTSEVASVTNGVAGNTTLEGQGIKQAQGIAKTSNTNSTNAQGMDSYTQNNTDQ